MKRKLLTCFLLVALVLSLSFLIGEEEDLSSEFNIENGGVTVDGVAFTKVDGTNVFSFENENGVLEIDGVVFENIKSSSEAGYDTFIKTDNQGNILEARFTSKGGSYIINGVDFDVPAESIVEYNPEDGLTFLDDGVKINNIDISEPVKITSFNEVEILEQFKVKGHGLLTEEGFIVEGGELTQNGVRVYTDIENPQSVLVLDSSKISTNYEGNWIKQDSEGISIKSSKGSSINMEFLEENKFFDVGNREGLTENQEREINLLVSDGDSLEIVQGIDLGVEATLPPTLNHKGSGNTVIQNGRHTFKFGEGEFTSELGNLNTKNKASVPLGINSELVQGKLISMDDDNGYLISDFEKGTKFSFDKSLFDQVNYEFESEIGKKMYSFSADQVGNSAYIWGGRGDVYYAEDYSGETVKGIRKEVPVEGIKGYDCIGLAISGLTEVYPDSELSDFPPNLGMVDALESRGWESSVVEPTSISRFTEDEIKKIPAGSIVFLMHEAEESLQGGREGVNTKYTTKKGEEIYLSIGHTLIRGAGESNFINAIPSYNELIPKKAREYDDFLISQGKDPIFSGSIKEGNLVPEEDYLIVISPPQ